jgi:hypothetical protein
MPKIAARITAFCKAEKYLWHHKVLEYFRSKG